MYLSDYEIAENLKRFDTDKERAEYCISIYLKSEPTVEEIQESKQLWKENIDIENVGEYERPFFQYHIIPFRDLLLQELEKQTSMGYNPYQE